MDLDTLERLCFEDPARGVEAAMRISEESARYYSILGKGLRRLTRYDDAERAFEHGLTLPATDFEKAEIVRRYGLLEFSRKRWHQAFTRVDHAISMHLAAGAAGLAGPPDRGLPAALIVRGLIRAAHTRRHPEDAGPSAWDDVAADYRHALKLAPDPRTAPLSHASAVHNLAVVAIEQGAGLTRAQEDLCRAAREMHAAGVPQSSAPAARMRWVRTVVHWQIFGQSDEPGTRFLRRIENRLERSHQILKDKGAAFDALLVAMDLALFYLENGPRWDDLRGLSVGVYDLDWSAAPEVLSGLLLWRQTVLEELTPPDALEFIWSRVRGLLLPDPSRHSHGEWSGQKLRPSNDSLVFRFARSDGPAF